MTSFTLPSGLPDAKRTHKTWLYVTVVVLLLLLAFGVRVWELGTADLSFDEVATFYVAHRPLREVLRYVMGAAREHPPAYYLVMSLWMQLAGVSEFAVRFPSVLMSVLAVSWSYKLGQRLTGTHGGWWTALLCAIMPFSVWAGRTGRMYALVLLLSLVVMESWLRWLAHPDWQHWLSFVMLSAVAAMTHYYLALLWPVQALVLIFLPRKTRSIRKSWLLTLVGISLFIGVFVAVSPGIRAMLLEVARRFPYKGFRGSELSIVFTDLYIWGFRPELSWMGSVGLGFTILGWVVFAHRERMPGVLVAAWGIVPLIIAHSIPEKLETRYLTPLFPALMLGLAALLAQLRFSVVRLLAIGGLMSLAAWRLPLLYENPDTSFSKRVATLHVAAKTGDSLLMNGPWPALLLEYYQPPEYLKVYSVPAKAPPGFTEVVDVPRLEQIFDKHDRVWVSYGGIHWADPQYSVSRWLAENTYRVFQRAGMALYLSPSESMTEVRAGVDLGPRLRLRKAIVDRQEAQVGDIVSVGLDFEGDNLDQYISITIGLLDGQGNTWHQEESRLGPVHQPHEATLPDHWNEQRGILLLPGLPPDQYTLAFKVKGEGIHTDEFANYYGWIPLSSLNIVPGATDPNLEPLLPNHTGVGAAFGDELSLVGVQPYAANVMQGYPTGFDLWWRVNESITASNLKIRLAGPEAWEGGTFPLGPEFYHPTAWQVGDVIRQNVSFQLPDKLTAGNYWVQIQVQADTGVPLVLKTSFSKGEWLDIFSVKVEARTRHYIAPLFRTRQDVRFGDVLRLRGYRLNQKNVHPGENVNLTVYWQALEAPSQIYAVFNHLRAQDGTILWQGDSWPQAGIYTTDRWSKNEIVAEAYTIEIPADLAPGNYFLYTGVYDPLTGTRLSAMTDRGEHMINDELIFLQLKILP